MIFRMMRGESGAADGIRSDVDAFTIPVPFV